MPLNKKAPIKPALACESDISHGRRRVVRHDPAAGTLATTTVSTLGADGLEGPGMNQLAQSDADAAAPMLTTPRLSSRSACDA